MSYAIYTLRDPRDNEVRYVGATRLPLPMRLEYHLRDVNDPNKKSPRVQWLQELVRESVEPIIEEIDLIETKDPEEAGRREDEWIKLYKEKDCDLLNVQKGGTGLYPRDGLSQWAMKRLGKTPDTIIAEHEDKHPQTIGYWRRKLDISAYRDCCDRSDWVQFQVRVPLELGCLMQAHSRISGCKLSDIVIKATLMEVEKYDVCDLEETASVWDMLDKVKF